MNAVRAATVQIVHEAEAQRQHARYRLPARVKVNGGTYEVRDFSVGGFSIEDIDSDLKPGAVKSFDLVFGFDSYELQLEVEGEVRYNDRGRQRLGIKFVNASSRQVNVIRYIIGASLAGEIVDAGDIIEVTARPMTATSRGLPPAPKAASLVDRVRFYARRTLAWTVLGAVTLGVLGYLATSLYDRAFVVHARSSMVSGDTYVLAAPMDGQLDGLVPNGRVTVASPVFTVTERPGRSAEVVSPCNCLVREAFSLNGTYVRAGDKVASLVTPQSKQFIEALVERRELPRLFGDVTVRVRLVDGTVIENATIRRMPTLFGREGSVELLSIEVNPQRELPMSLVGRPAIVTFDDSRNSAAGRVIDTIVRGLSGLKQRVLALFQSAGGA
jgi:alginate biosynthesis protein Alg44